MPTVITILYLNPAQCRPGATIARASHCTVPPCYCTNCTVPGHCTDSPTLQHPPRAQLEDFFGVSYRRNMPLGLPRPAAEVGGASTSQNPALATLCPRWAHWHQKRNSHALNYHRARNVLEKVRRYPGAPWRGCARPGCTPRAGFLRCGCSVLCRPARAARAIFLPLWRYSAVLGCI